MSSFSGLIPILNSAYIADKNNGTVFGWSPTTRNGSSTNNVAVFTFTDLFRAYDSAGNNGVAVHTLLTNHTDQIAGKLGTNGLTAVGIAAAGGVITNSIPGPGCTYLGTSQDVSLTGATTSYRAEPAGVYTVSVAQAASRYTYALEVVSTNPCTLSAGLNLQGSWTITGTNILAIVPCTGTLWRVYGRGL